MVRGQNRAHFKFEDLRLKDIPSLSVGEAPQSENVPDPPWARCLRVKIAVSNVVFVGVKGPRNYQVSCIHRARWEKIQKLLYFVFLLLPSEGKLVKKDVSGHSGVLSFQKIKHWNMLQDKLLGIGIAPSYDSIKGDTEGIMRKDQIGCNASEMIPSQERYWSRLSRSTYLSPPMSQYHSVNF